LFDFEQFEDRRMLATFHVTTNADAPVNTPAAVGTLRQAIQDANNQLGPDSIDFASNLSGATITLTQGELAIAEFAGLTIDASMLPAGITIDGNDPTPTQANGDGIRIFHITDPTFGSSPPLVTMKNLTLTGGDVLGNGGAIFSEEGRLVLENCTIESNSALTGGGITLWADNSTGNGLNYLSLRNTRVQNNTAFTSGSGGAGGGIYVQASNADISILQSSSITGNKSQIQGGGLFITASSDSQVHIADTKIEANTNYGALGGGMYVGNSGALVSIKRTTISGNSSVLAGGGMSLHPDASGETVIEDSKIEFNYTTGFQNNGNPSGAGVYIHSKTSSSLTISGTSISYNEARGIENNSGGIRIRAETASTIILDHVKITENQAGDDCGGLDIWNDGSEVTVQYSTISGNTANENHVSVYDSTGGFYLRTTANGSSTIKYSTISENKIKFDGTNNSNDGGKRGGGLFIISDFGTTTTILNTTISGNEAEGNGGGIKISAGSAGTINILHSTITNNRADSNGDSNGEGGGIHVGAFFGTLTLDHTIVAGNWRGAASGTPTRDDIVGSVTAGWSLIGDNTSATITTVSGTTNQIGTSGSPINPHLAPLAFNGGPTQTHALLSNSSAIDAGNPSAVAGSGGVPLFDQRGEPFARVLNVLGINGNSNRIDIGAYEVGLAKVIDVRLNGIMLDDNNLPWVRAPYSFATLVPEGKQLAPIFTDGVNKISIAFSEAVNLTANSLTLLRSGGRHMAAASVAQVSGGFSYDADKNVATWTFAPLARDKYRIEIVASDATGLAGLLDGEWHNYDGPVVNGIVTSHTPEIYGDDPTGRTFITGDGIAGGNFEFLFAYLPYDYNQNGVVDDADLVMLRNEAPDFDGNGDGVEDIDDEDLWRSHIDQQISIQLILGDYDDNYFVGLADYALWRLTYGSTTDLRADGNGNGLVDGADYSLWRAWENTQGAWYQSIGGFGAMLPVVDFANAPRVLNVTISGSNSVHDPYSFDSHVGSGEQLRTVPVGGADTVSITFSEDVNVMAGNLRLVGLLTCDVPTLVEFAYDMATMTATWRFDDLLAFDHYLISLSDAITDIEGNRLDGEWVNPASLTTTSSLVSEFPSGDGHSGGNFNFVFTLLAGDANLNNNTDNWDYYIFQDQWGVWGAGLFEDGDFDGDGYITEADFALYDLNYQTWDLSNPYMRADFNGDFVIDDDDLQILANNIGVSNPQYGDLNGDNQVDSADLAIMTAFYGCGFRVAS